MAYTIQRGDTLSAIAKANNTTVADIMAANPNIKDANKIYTGNTLNLPGAVTPTAAATPTAPVTPAAPDIQSILSSVPTTASNTYGISATPETFNYDPSTDASLQQYLNRGNASIMQTMADRGILNSTTTTSQIAQLLAQATPEYEQAAYSRWSDEQNRALQRANFLSGLDQTAYSQAQDLQNTLYSQLASLDDEGYAQYKTQLATTQAQRTSNIQQAQAYYEQRKTELEAAIAKVNQTGIVDNDTALILGVDPGTPAANIASAVAAKQQELQNMQLQIANLVAYDRQQTQAENSATALRDAYYNPRVLTTMSSPTTSGTGGGSGNPLAALWESVRSGSYNLTETQVQQIGLLVLNGADKNTVMAKINEFVSSNTPAEEAKPKVTAGSAGGKKIRMTK